MVKNSKKKEDEPKKVVAKCDNPKKPLLVNMILRS